MKKLDLIHEKAQTVGDLTLGPLKSRREAAAISFMLKLLDGKGRGVLNAYASDFVDNPKLHRYSTKNAPKGLQFNDRSRHNSPISFLRFERSYRMNWYKKVRRTVGLRSKEVAQSQSQKV